MSRVFFVPLFLLTSLCLAGETTKPAAPTGDELKKICEQHFPSVLQGATRQACLAGAKQQLEKGATRADLDCRLAFGHAAGTTMTCLIGARIAAQLSRGEDDFRKRWQHCNEHYPSHTEVDSYLQESCLIGYYLTDLMPTAASKTNRCQELSTERTFLGPCSVGAHLFDDDHTSANSRSKELNLFCEKYFDHKVFHTGYRSCLNAKGLPTTDPPISKDIVKNCATLTTAADPESEKAACVVGVSLLRRLQTGAEANSRYGACGATKVTYDDREVLACLTAVSLLDFSDQREASSLCKEVFNQKKSHSRGDCVRFVETVAKTAAVGKSS